MLLCFGGGASSVVLVILLQSRYGFLGLRNWIVSLRWSMPDEIWYISQQLLLPSFTEQALLLVRINCGVVYLAKAVAFASPPSRFSPSKELRQRKLLLSH